MTIDCFTKNKTASDGLNWQCKICYREYYEANKETYFIRSDEFYKRNRLTKLARQRERREADGRRIRIRA